VPHSTVVIRVDDSLKAAFADAAKAADRTTSQLLRDFMRDYVKGHADDAEYDAWFRRQVAKGLADVRAGRTKPGKEVEAHFAKRRERTMKNLRGSRG